MSKNANTKGIAYVKNNVKVVVFDSPVEGFFLTHYDFLARLEDTTNQCGGTLGSLLEKTGEGWIQADRGGKPLQAVFLPGDEREAYLNGEPADDHRFISAFAHELEHSGGYTTEEAVGVARKLLPDILSCDPRGPARFPHNGRTLTDDVVDVFFSTLTNGKVTG